MAILFAQHLELGLGLQEQGKGGQEARVSEQGTGGRGKGFRSKAQGHRVPEQGTGGQVLKVRRRGGSVPPPHSSPFPCRPPPPPRPSPHRSLAALPRTVLLHDTNGRYCLHRCHRPRSTAASRGLAHSRRRRSHGQLLPLLQPLPQPLVRSRLADGAERVVTQPLHTPRQHVRSRPAWGATGGRWGVRGGGGPAVEAPAATACTPARYSLSTRPHQHTQLRT